MSHILTEGGQITTHRLRMLRQVLKTIVFGSMAFGFCLFICLMIGTPKYYFLALWYYCKVAFAEGFTSHIEVSKDFLSQAAHTHYNHNPSLSLEYMMRLTTPIVSKLFEQAQISFYKAAYSSIVCFFVILLVFLYRGFASKSKKELSGPKIQSARYIGINLRLTRKSSLIKIGSLPLIKGTETQHMLITGGTGSGKTNCLHHILKQLRYLDQKAIIVDTTGTFLEKYYLPEKDILLNPFHSNSKTWHPWSECTNSFDYADIAEAFIPHSNAEHENYWRLASKTVFTALLQKFGETKKTSDIVRWMHFEPLSSLCKLLEGTKAAAHMDMNSEKTASSVRSVSSTFLECLEGLKDTTDPFSIKEWMGKSSGSWLFLQCAPNQRAYLRPLMSAWISSAIKGLLSLEPDFKRRVWFIMDELPTLQRVKDLETLLTEGRKYGGCGVISIQTPAQLDNLYGRESTKVIIGNTATKVIFSEQDPEIAERISKSFGVYENLEVQEGISYGAHETRDSVSLSSQYRIRPVVSATQIQELKPNTAFIKLPGGYPVSKVKLKIAG